MLMWSIIFGTAFLAAGAALAYLVSRFYRFHFLEKMARGKKPVRILLAILCVTVITAGITLAMGAVNTIICLLHLAVFWLLADLIFRLIAKSGKRFTRAYYAGGFAIVITVCYLTAGWILVHGVWETDYVIGTAKEAGKEGLRIVQFADSHMGTTFSGEEFSKYVQEMQDANPDVVLITGDFVDDGTSKADMIAACQALGNFHTTYGVYFAFGNHDKGYYADSYRGYGAAELISELEKNGVTVLQDETVALGDNFYLIGRQDRSEETDRGGSRASMAELTADLDPSKFTIVMDHQPCDYENQKDAGVDLVLSGHTHGGQLIPLNLMGPMVSQNDQIYGMEQRENTNFIVTSGISDWAIQFKTGCHSEYVVIDIQG